jgi:hypothetical protein
MWVAGLPGLSRLGRRDLAAVAGVAIRAPNAVATSYGGS